MEEGDLLILILGLPTLLMAGAVLLMIINDPVVKIDMSPLWRAFMAVGVVVINLWAYKKIENMVKIKENR